MIIRYLIITLFFTMNVMSEVTPAPENEKLSGHDFTLTWSFLYQKDGEKKYLHVLDLSNISKKALEGRDWALYFNLIHRIKLESITPVLDIERINGHFYKITPGKKFRSLMPGKTLQITFETQIPTFKQSDIPSGFYMVFNDDEQTSVPQPISPVHLGAEITADQTIRAQNDNTPVTTAKSRYNENNSLSILPLDKISKIIPSPVRYSDGGSSWVLNTSVSIHFQQGLENEVEILTDNLEKLLGKRLTTVMNTTGSKKTIVLKISDLEVDNIPRKSGDEAYLLSINTEKGIEITGTDEAGVFYGIQSLCALMPIDVLGKISDQIVLEEVAVEDAPRYIYRGIHLDVARNFQSKETVLKFLDRIAFYKLNKFHFHLTDDEGWRLEIKSFPELTEVGGQRGHTIDEKDRLIPSFGSGPNNERIRAFYSQDEFIEILKFANKRHIQVIPEIDIPGHARAAIKSMEARYHKLILKGKVSEATAYRLVDPEDQSVYTSAQNFNDNVINVCIPSTYRFLERVIDEVIDMYQKANVPLSMIHIGGDEVPGGTWLKSPICENLISEKKEIANYKNLQDYFLQKISEIMKKRGLSIAGWEEIALIENSEGKIPNEKYIKQRFIPYVWNNVWGWGSEDVGYRLANSGYKVVLCNATNLYFDCAYNKDPEEPGLYWAGFVDTRKAFEFTPDNIFMGANEDRLGNKIDLQNYKDKIRLTDKGQKNILGIQGQLWGERLVDSLRLDYMAFPKVIGLAERAWAKKPEWVTIQDKDLRELKFQLDWNAFVNSVGQREMIRLDYFEDGVAYRIPPPGAVIEDGMLKANSAYPGLEIRFTRDGSDPKTNSELYQSPVEVSSIVKLCSFNSIGRRSRITKISD